VVVEVEERKVDRDDGISNRGWEVEAE